MIFVDEAKIFVNAGNGGKGCESFFKDKHMRYPRPNGGDGGKGGNVIVYSDKSIQTLLDFKFRQHHKAQNGGNASSKNKKGKDGLDCYIKVPIGTVVRDHKTGLLIRDLSADQQSVVVAKGGKGGIGNGRKKLPAPPKKGEERALEFELKIVADVGIVGFPNAGKSTLISSISKVKSKIAGYPFTTKQPILGIVNGNSRDFVIADLPGIIEGAHSGRGLGDRFLRHAERTKFILHVIDMGASENRDPINDYEKIADELKKHSSNLAHKERILVANKMDLPDALYHLKRFKKKYKVPIIEISALEKKGLDKIINKIEKML